MTNLFEIIEKVNHNRTDLNLLIANINKICQKEKKTNFNKKDLNIIIPENQLDSFADVKKMKDFFFCINYSIIDKSF